MGNCLGYVGAAESGGLRRRRAGGEPAVVGAVGEDLLDVAARLGERDLLDELRHVDFAELLEPAVDAVLAAL